MTCSIEEPLWKDDEGHELTYQEAECLFHEFGHVLQCLMMRGDISRQERDVSEFMSQLMEFFLVDPEPFLEKNSQPTCESTPREPTSWSPALPIKNYFRNRLANALFLSHLELELYARFDPSEESILEVQRRALEKHHPQVFQSPEASKIEKDLSNVLNLLKLGFANDAGYYKYVYSLAMAVDAFDRLRSLNGEERAREGRRMRELLFVSDVCPKEAFKEWRGKDISMNALTCLIA